MIKINTRSKNLTPEKVHNLVYNTILWCQSNLGVNNRRSKKFTAQIQALSLDAMGDFNYKTNTITVYHWNNRNVKEIICTTIHEYTHYLQPIRTKYNKLAKVYKYYSKHPMERQAVRMERHYKTCWNEIRKNIL
jgi:hypothetical protein